MGSTALACHPKLHWRLRLGGYSSRPARVKIVHETSPQLIKAGVVVCACHLSYKQEASDSRIMA
jgi:hypothetical protein